jgi:hypothetical protein
MYSLPPLRDKLFSGGALIKLLYYCDEEQWSLDGLISGKKFLLKSKLKK